MRACLPSPGLGLRFVVAVLVLSGGMGTRSATAQSLFDVPGLGNRPQSGSSGLSSDRLAQLARERLRSGAASAESTEPNEAAPPDLRTRPRPPQTPSRIELLLSRDASLDVNDVSIKLKQFGYDMFGAPVSTFAPVTNVPVGPDYVIGPGDGFTLTLWGRVDAQHTLQVDRSGQICCRRWGPCGSGA